ncbi:MAG TPA: hypothetical protein VK457_13125, partial [Chloroflexota bacterium]|nr:hypothetical protein [Chloroflexota bacterium]
MDSDLHVIESGDVYERYLDDKFRDRAPKYMGLGPTNFPWWIVEGQHIPPWATSEPVASAQRYLDAPTEDVYRDIRQRGYTAESALAAMDQEGIDMAVVFRTFAHMVVSIDGLEGRFAAALSQAFNR